LLARERTQVATDTAGSIKRLSVEPGSRVSKGQPIVELENHEIDLELSAAHAALAEVDARLRVAMAERTADIKPLSMRHATLSDRVRKLEADKAALVIKARHDGIWTAPDLRDQVGRWVARGTRLGLLVNPESFEFAATVKQEDGDALFRQRPSNRDAAAISGAEVMLLGQAGTIVPIRSWRVIPSEQKTLPSPALGWMAGGEVPVSSEDPQQALEPFFELHADVQPDTKAALLHGRSGKIRFDLEPEPLLQRGVRRLLQLIQKRYQL
jgi:putative peptide zinc metalloprotease protein